MDQLGKGMNNLSLWEVKSYVRKAQNAVLNLSDIEAKVREATNNEPWGASTTLMSEIARGTFNYRDREEISNMIFRRFTEKSAHEWRQIYKSLQLMEYLVKNGSERYVDDARANVSLVSMLKSFHYIDSKGVDQGINIRNRAKELTNLLNDESKIRQERKKAKENSKKFDAISSTSASSRNLGANRRSSNRINSSSNNRYNSNINNDDGYENRIFGDGGVFGQRFEENRSTTISPNEFEEYDDNENSHNNNNNQHTRRTSKPSIETNKINASANSNIDLFDFNDEPITTNNKKFYDNNNNNNNEDDDDDFDDFQSATPATVNAPASNHLTDLLTTSHSSSQSTKPQYQNINNNFGTNSTPVISQPKATDDIFGSLLMSAKQTVHTAPKTTSTLNNNNINNYVKNNTNNDSNGNGNTNVKQNNNSGIVDLLDL
jgi:epsin